MFKQQLTSALGDALGHYGNGESELDSVVKSASDNKFNPMQTRRLVETFNTAKSIHHYKTADARADHFDIVDPADAISELFGPASDAKSAAAKAPAKTASATLSEVSNSVNFYDQAPQAPAVKVASANSEFKVTEYDAPSPDQVATEIYRKQAAYERQAEHSQAEIDACNGYYNINIHKVATLLDSDIHEGHRHRMLQAIVAKYAESGASIVSDLDNLIRHKVAEADMAHFPRIITVDAKFPEFFGKVAMLVEKTESGENHSAIKTAYLDAAQSLRDITGFSVQAGEELDKTANTVFELPGVASSALTSGIETVKEVIQPQDASETKALRADKLLTNLRRQVLLQDLLVNDDILAGADPESIRSNYQAIIDVAPQQALQKEIVRSYLRQAVNSPGGMSPFDAKALADVQSTINKGQLDAVNN